MAFYVTPAPQTLFRASDGRNLFNRTSEGIEMAVTHATRTHSFRPGRTLAIVGIALALVIEATDGQIMRWIEPQLLQETVR